MKLPRFLSINLKDNDVPYHNEHEMAWLRFPVYVGNSIIQILIYENISVIRWEEREGGQEEKKWKERSPPFHPSLHLFVYSAHCCFF